jgi:glyoxylase-like metal-dependent hydrolase (beta-lactamase superfamily II)
MNEFLGKWVKAEGVSVDFTADDFNGRDFEFLDLKGHSHGMIGMRKGEFIFASDSFFSKEIVDKHIVPYFHNFDDFVFNLEELKNLDYDLILPSHGTLYTKEEAIDTINYNLARVKEIESTIIESIKTPKTLSQIMQTLNLQVEDVVVFTLIESSIKSILHSHINKGDAEPFIEKGNLYYSLKNKSPS